MKKTVKDIRIGLPRGYSFQIIDGMFDSYYNNAKRGHLNNDVDVRLMHGEKCIGHIDLRCDDYSNVKVKDYTTHSFLSTKYRHKGLGERMYAKAIAWCLISGHQVHSHHASSPKAQRVWKGKYLASKFTITVKKNPYDYCQWVATLKNK